MAFDEILILDLTTFFFSFQYILLYSYMLLIMKYPVPTWYSMLEPTSTSADVLLLIVITLLVLLKLLHNAFSGMIQAILPQIA